MHTAELDSAVRFTRWSFLKFEYLGEIETEFENTLACLSGAQMGLNHEKTGGQKSRDTLPLRSNTLSRTRFQYETPKNNFQI